MGEEKEKKDKSLVPGIGVSGQVFCPLGFMAPKLCLKQGCEWWVEFDYVDKKVARCSMVWLSVVSTEIRRSIDQLRDSLIQKGGKDASTKESSPSPE